ncbi:MAG: carboxypeptidase regulatory-like domain-containing protein [Myxococcota bacterium]
MKLPFAASIVAALACGEVQIGSEGGGGSTLGSGGSFGGVGSHAGFPAAGGHNDGVGGIAGGAPPNGGFTAGGALAMGGAAAMGGASPAAGHTAAMGGSVADGGTLASSGGAVSSGGDAGATSNPCEKTLIVGGRVTTPSGAPVPNVKLTLSGSFSAETTTDVNGAYAFRNLCAGYYLVEPSHPQFSFCGEPALNVFLQHDVREDFNATSVACKPAGVEVRLRVLIFDPQIDGQRRLSDTLDVEPPTNLVKRGLRALQTLSNGHVHYRPPVISLIDELPAMLDLRDIEQRNQLCSHVAGEQYDEVWLVVPEGLGLPAWQNLDADCHRDIDVLAINWPAGLNGFLATMQQRSEAVLAKVFERDGDDSPFRGFTRNAAGGPSGCGTSLRAPNAQEDTIFDDTRAVSSYCAVYLDDPFTTPIVSQARPTSCSEWFCNEFDYRRYWLMHLPKLSGVDQNGHLKDWWRLSTHADDRRIRLHDGTAVSCSESYSSGWCEYLLDGVYGSCNDNEWAFSAASAYADFYFATPRSIKQVTLYDRACDEFVHRGHLEFSDGSPNVPFGVVDDKLNAPTLVTFEPRTVSQLRVVIDEAHDGNPGLAEVVIE